MLSIKKGILVGLSSIILLGSVAPVVSAMSYEVVEGDTITSILDTYGITLNELLVLNPELDGGLLNQLELEGRLDSYVIDEGTKLEIDLGVLDTFVMRDAQTTNLDEVAHTDLDEAVQSVNEEGSNTDLDEAVQSVNEEGSNTDLDEAVQSNNEESAHTDLDEAVQSNNEESAHTDLDEAVQSNNEESAHTDLDEAVQSNNEDEAVQSIVDEWASLGSVETDSTYTIKRGDTAWGVANRNGLTLAKLYALNGGEAATASKFMRIGSVLVISGSTNNTMSVPNTSNAQSSNNTSVVSGSVSLVGMNESAKLGSLEISNKYNVPIISALRAGDSQDHGKGLAADFGVPVSSAIGDEVAAYAVNNMDRLGITYVIWKQRIYGNWNRKWVMMENRGSITQNHLDHVHVSYSGLGKSTVNEWTNPNKSIVNVYESVYEPKMDTTMDLPVYRVPNADMDLVYAIVQQEGGYSYESALWVMGTIMNRVNSSQFPNTIDGVIKQRGQFESYWAGHYKKHLGKIGPEVKRAVDDVINGKIVHDNLFFWSASYASMMGRRGVNVGGNVYFKVY